MVEHVRKLKRWHALTVKPGPPCVDLAGLFPPLACMEPFIARRVSIRGGCATTRRCGATSSPVSGSLNNLQNEMKSSWLTIDTTRRLSALGTGKRCFRSTLESN